MKIDANILKALGLITQIGISMMIPIALCLFLGQYLDEKLGTSPWLLIIFIVLGVLAAFRNLYMLTISFTKSDKKRK
jgi:F0F1-type ATP synthase assembly protein I